MLDHNADAADRYTVLDATEDALHLVRTRLEGICRAAGVPLADLPIHVITAPRVRLDLAEDRQQLKATVAAWQPILLVLDPFVRLHRIDENASSEVAPLLAYLRDLQRRSPSRSCSSIMRAKAHTPFALGRRCGAAQSSTPGAIRISI